MSDFGTSPGASWAHAVQPPPLPPAQEMMFELRPLTLGEILDRTFSLYRKRFWLFAGLSSMAAAVTSVGTFLRLIYGVTGTNIKSAAGPKAVLVGGAISLATGMVYFMAYSVTQAATVSAVFAVYLGRETSIDDSLRMVKRWWYRYMLISLWQSWSALWLPMLLFTPAVIFLVVLRFNLSGLGMLLIVLALLSLIYAVIAYIRNSVGIPASVVETLTVRAAMRRSKVLVAGHKGRVFGLLVLLYVLNAVAGAAQGVFAVLFSLTHSAARVALGALTLVTTFVTTSLVAPVAAIALCLFYIDERVRKEGYDLEALMDRAGTGSADPRADTALPSPFSSSELI